MNDNLGNEIKKIKPLENKVGIFALSDLIKDAENKMRVKGYCVPVEFGTLKWEKLARRFSITCEGKPLHNCSLEIRVAKFDEIIPLIRTAKDAFDKLYRVSPSEIATLEGFLENL
jgi:hypothetical protein